MQPSSIVFFLLQNLVCLFKKLLLFYFCEGGVDSDTVPAKLGETSVVGASFYQSLVLCGSRFWHPNFKHADFFLAI